MTSYIEAGPRTFKRCHSINIKSSRKTLSDTCTVKLANLKSLLNDPDKKLNVGDKIEVSFGYNGNNNVEFTGYIAEIKPTSPMEIICEDEMWKMKQQTVSKSWRSVTLKEVLKFLADLIDTTECPDITLSPFRLDKVTKYQALQKLKEEFGIDVYYRDKKLFAGLAYTENGGNRVRYHFQKNVPTMMQQSGLTYKRKSDVRIKLQAISLTPKNKRLQVDLGDPDGEAHTLHFYNLTKEQLKQQGQAKIDLMKYDGYRGTLLTFGLPKVKHGDVASMEDGLYPDKEGDFFVDSVESDYGPDGIRRHVELGKKASE